MSQSATSGLTAPKPRNMVTWRAVRKQLRRHFLASVLLFVAGIVLCSAVLALLLMLGQLSVSHTLVLRGQVQAIEQAVPVAHNQSGTIKEIFITEGQMVQEGQILATLDTTALMSDVQEARKRVAQILLAIECLRAQRASAVEFTPSLPLKQAMGRLQQLTELRRGTRDCQVDLRKLALEQTNNILIERTALDVAHLYRRIAQTELATQSTSVLVSKQDGRAYDVMPQLLSAFESTARAKRSEQEAKQLSSQLVAAELDRQRNLDQRIDALSDQLVLAEAELSTQENLLKQRNVYATASGRIQRLRIKEAGKQLAKGAHFVEIAPVQTDFEVQSRASVLEASNLRVGQTVQVKLSGGMPRPVWIPAKVYAIRKLSENKRLISILLTRADLNQRDLLRGDRSLNGLGEQSEAVVAIKPENALNTLRQIMWQFVQQWRANPAQTDNPTAATA